MIQSACAILLLAIFLIASPLLAQVIPARNVNVPACGAGIANT